MEITLESIISFIGLFIGGSAGAWFTWRWQKRKAKAEAETAEVDTVKNMQEAYDKMFEQVNRYLEDATGKVEGLRQERDHYKRERDELRGDLEKLTRQFSEFKTENEKEILSMRRDIARNARMVDALRPFLCGREGCQIRMPVTISKYGEVERPAPAEPKEIEPYDDKD